MPLKQPKIGRKSNEMRKWKQDSSFSALASISFEVAWERK